MPIAAITEGDLDAITKMNAAIAKANEVDAKATTASLASEATARASADAALQDQIDERATVEALSAEATARAGAVAAANQARAEADANEVTARQNADEAEAEARESADAALGVRIEGRATYAEVAAEHDRPGEPGRFATPDIAGAPETVALLEGSRAVSASNGAVVAIRAGYVAPIAVRRIEPGRQYRLRFVVQRAEDTSDPANDAIRFAVSWLKADKSKLSETILANVLDVQVSSGRLEFLYIVSRVEGDNVDVVCPTGAVYARPFVRCYGSGLTHVEVIEWTDLSNSVDWSPDVSEFRRELAGFEFAIDTLNDRADAAAAGLDAATDASYIKTGTLDDARLSTNVMLLDAEQTVTADKIFVVPLRMRDYLLIGDGEATGGGASARIAGSGNAFEIAPTNQAGDYIVSKTFGFDLVNGVWRAKGGFRAEGALTATGAISGVSLAISGAATVGTNLTVAADLTVGNDLAVTDDATIGGDLAVAGATTIAGGTINGTTIGLTTAAAGRFTSAAFTDPGTTRTNLDVYDKAYVDNLIAAADAMVFKGVIDCSTNPNYPAAEAGWTYRVSVAGKIGGASGVNVEIGDLLVCLADSTASGTQAAVGANWSIAQVNIDGAVVGPASATDATPAVFDGATGKLIKNITFADFKTALALVKADVGLGSVDNTSDAGKPVSTAQASAIALKYDKTGGQLTGAASILADSAALFVLDRNNAGASKAAIQWKKQGALRWELGPDVGGADGADFYLFDHATGAMRSQWRADGMVGPGADNFQTSGSPSFRWSAIHTVKLFAALADFADDSAAAAGGILVGELYRTAGAVKIRIS